MLFATCSFKEYRDEMGGLPVRSANGIPRFKLRYPPHAGAMLPKFDVSFPQWNLVRASRSGLDQAGFEERYRDGLNMIGLHRIRDEAELIRAQHERWSELLGREITADTPLVLLCYEKLDDGKGTYCHRSAFAAWWTEQTSERVVELGARPHAELAADDQPGLF